MVNSKITGSSHAALMAYVKKNEYGGAVLEVSDTIISESGASMSDLKSELLLDGKRINGVNMDTKELYSTIMKPGLK